MYPVVFAYTNSIRSDIALNPAEFAAEVVLVSASGVLSPGPLFFANIIYGSRMGMTAGIKIAYGHTLVELPLIIILAGFFAFSYVFLNNENLKIIGFVGGISIICFAFTQIINVRKNKVGKVDSKLAYAGVSKNKGPILLGAMFSPLNPLFLI
jgi:threonine/homoserine/homoserine lactone efflux protein